MFTEDIPVKEDIPVQKDYISRMASNPCKKKRSGFFSIFLEEIAMKDRGSRTSFFLHPSKDERLLFPIVFGGNSSGKITFLEHGFCSSALD
jgi:hypothetical protein